MRPRLAHDSTKIAVVSGEQNIPIGQAAIQSGINQLRQELSVAGWNGLTAHINGDHRASIQVNFPVVPVLPPGTAH
jgi:hypothetical protein